MQLTLGDSWLFYKRYGRGVPILVMHGGPGVDHSYFRPYLDALGNVAELIYYDHRGGGRSGGQQEVGHITLEHWAQDAEALRQALRLDRVVVLGHGFGGFIAQTYARMYPHNLLGLILSNTSPALDYPAEMLGRAREYGSAEAMAALMASICQPVPTDDSLRQLWRTALPLYFCRYQPMFGPAMDEGMCYSAAAYNRGMFELAPHFNSTAWLGDVEVPTLVLAGAHDWLAPKKEGIDRLMAHLSEARVQVFEHSGHYPFIEEPTAYGHAIRQYLRDLPPRELQGL
jgi:proline iminopeptidase